MIVSAQVATARQDAAPARAAAPSRDGLSEKDRERAQAMIARSITWLKSKQDAKTGAWGVYPGAPVFPAVTGLVVAGLHMQPGLTDADPAIALGVKFMLEKQQQDGGIYEGLLPSYNTAICLSALANVQQPAGVAEARRKAIKFLKSIQYGEGAVAYADLSEAATKVEKDHAYYGGWGYGNRGRPDLSNTSFVLEGLHDAGLPENDPAYQRAVQFLQRCQMVESAGGRKVNDAAYAKGSSQGGFIYATSVNKDNVGVGQSFAGEIVESLDGPHEPGVRATLTLPKGPDGKQMTMTRAKIEERLRAAAAETAELADGFVVALGHGMELDAAPEFSIQLAAAPPARVREALAGIFAEELGAAPAIDVVEISSWRGTSRLRAYGSMTYAGFKSYLFAGLTRDDPRVLAARAWMSENYSLEENPGMGTDGLYYYLVMFARANRAAGEVGLAVRSASGAVEQRNWRKDLIERLETLQNSDGSFRSVDDRWMENDPVLITAYGLVALQNAVR